MTFNSENVVSEKLFTGLWQDSGSLEKLGEISKDLSQYSSRKTFNLP